MGLDLYHLAPTRNASEGFYFTIGELNTCKDYVERHEQFIIEEDLDEASESEVIYFESKGYQRKGVKAEFFTCFENDKPYFNMQDVIKAYRYLDADHINTLSKLQENFKENFIDNFEEGESIFFVSW